MTCFTVENGPPSRPPRNWQHYRGFDHLGRWGPQSGRPGHRPPGKIRHFRNALRSFPGREAGSVWETHNTIEESTSRMAFGTVIYGISGDAVLRIRNTHGDSTSRPVAGPVIYGIFGDAACGIGDTHEDSTPRAAKRPTLSRNRSLVRRFCRVFSVRWGARSSVSRAARGFCPAGPQNHGTSASQVAQFACGTPVLAPRSAKTQDNSGPEAPGGEGAGGCAGKPREHEPGKSTSEIDT